MLTMKVISDNAAALAYRKKVLHASLSSCWSVLQVEQSDDWSWFQTENVAIDVKHWWGASITAVLFDALPSEVRWNMVRFLSVHWDYPGCVLNIHFIHNCSQMTWQMHAGVNLMKQWSLKCVRLHSDQSGIMTKPPVFPFILCLGNVFRLQRRGPQGFQKKTNKQTKQSGVAAAESWSRALLEEHNDITRQSDQLNSIDV